MTDATAREIYSCGMCGSEFRKDRGQPACRACPLSDGCRYVRCPDCGHENPVRPGWIERLRSWLEGRAGESGEEEAGTADPTSGAMR